VVPLALALPLALAGCGANFEAQTYQERTVADGTNSATGAIAVRNVTVLPSEEEEGVLSAGDDAEVVLTLTNDGPEDDQLVEVTSPAADDVEITDSGRTTSSFELPRLGTTGTGLGLTLTGLSEDLRPGQYVEITFRFERNGEVTVSAPVATTGEHEEREHSDNFHQIGEDAH
jgi:copper(I)-binding protein